MMVDNIMNSASLLGACEKSNGVTDWKTLGWLFFSPQGREFCEENNFPGLATFQQMKPFNVEKHGVFVDFGNISRSNDKDIALIGETHGELFFDDNKAVHKIILMHGAEVVIHASNYVVLLVVKIGDDCKVSIHKDKTVVVL